MKNIKFMMALVAALMISGCGPDSATNLEDSLVDTPPSAVGSATPSAKFDPSNSVIPFPNDLLFARSADGTLNIPVADASDLSDPQVALNALDGFSTSAPLSATFSTAIDSSSIGASSVKLYQVTLSSTPGGAPVAVNTQLTYGVDYIAAISSVDSSQSTLAIVPLKPFTEKSSYSVVITDSLLASGGEAFGPSITYRLFKTLSSALDCSYPIALDYSNCNIPGAFITKLLAVSDEAEFNTTLASLEGLRQLITVAESTIAASDSSITADDIILSWSFTTQSVGDVLTKVRTDIRAGAVPTSVLVDSGANSALGAADIYIGTLDVPYYLTAASGVNDATPLSSYWQGAAGSLLTRYNTTPIATSTQTIPLMVSVPMTAEPVSGYPVVIFQHGITTNRAVMLALADSMAAAGMAVVAIDMPMHGLTGNETDGTENFYKNGALNTTERTFDLDLVDNTSGTSGPDSITDSSGKHFINLTNLLNTRDNVRQAVSDLFTLTYALEGMSAGGASFDTSKIYFIGHSLGAMVGTPFLALESNIRDAALVFGGSSLPKILDGSAAFSPQIVTGLAAAGVNKGTADYESFIGAAQTVVDSADPVNYASDAATGRGILFFEIAGGSSSPSDLVVPNTVPDTNDSGSTVAAPLAGTDAQLALMGLTQVNTDQAGADLKHSIKFVVGNHSSLLSGAADNYSSAETNAAVRAEIQTIIATFLASDGAVVNVNETLSDTLLEAP